MSSSLYTHEWYSQNTASEPVRSNGELLIGMDVSTFRFKATDVDSQLYVFPSMTDPGRFRPSAQSNLRFELVEDLLELPMLRELRFPAARQRTRNDLGITTALGWTY